jgi:UDP-GlcNAc3NAcA epimerase
LKICNIVGARPQFIKAAMVVREFKKHPHVQNIIIHTGQHYDHEMSEVFFSEMGIPDPKYNLGIRSFLHGEMTGRMIEGIEKILLDEKPDAVLVYGDTNSTIAGAIAAVKLHIRVIHVEAGLRSFNMNMPEEINRIVTDRVSSLLFCPTKLAMANLEREGYNHLGCKYIFSGDVMLDAALYYSEFSLIKESVVDKIDLKEYILCTVHRAENTNDPVKIKDIVTAINIINKEIPVVFPIHPRTKKTLSALGLELECTLIDPVGYIEVLKLIKNCELVMTDSGGLQREAYFLRKPCVCLREETEWIELRDSGNVALAGSDKEKIISAVKNYKKLSSSFSEKFFGNGDAASIIVNQILQMQT